MHGDYTPVHITKKGELCDDIILRTHLHACKEFERLFSLTGTVNNPVPNASYILKISYCTKNKFCTESKFLY